MIDLAKMIIEKRQAEKRQARPHLIVSDIESRRFTAVLDAMDERLDPEKIERTRIAKYLVENEPVLIRDLLPEVMFYLPLRRRRCRANPRGRPGRTLAAATLLRKRLI